MKRKRLALRFIPLQLLILLSPILGADPAIKDPAASTQDRPWLATGSVVTITGQALPDVDIIAHTGIGSLKVGGRTKSLPDGTFRLPFGPGFWSKDGEGLQVATI